ncbi:endonuclease/exonuclease/phosphatase family protein [Dactylosporangium sp. CA-233914]|uniref:endonuclease/exonuclease/phosphatase family protein n=1 Tax=Dactylosporangium sp. CA-233914 TaxID=3239934 RepID=UPI003D940C24
MTRRGVRRTAAFLACLAAAVLGATPSPGEATRRPLRVLQMNLCDSGFAGCYTGRAIPAAAGAIRAGRPDVVSLNEICAGDVEALGRVMQELYPTDTVVRAFRAAGDRRSGTDFLCVNGEPYGIGLVVRLDPRDEPVTGGGLYPDQDTGDPEQRAWLCVHARGAFAACTTHLANTVPGVAYAQCRHLFEAELPSLHARSGYVPTVVAGDFNLLEGAKECVPGGHPRADDGAVQYVIATADLAVTATTPFDLAQATDHPGLLVSLAAVRPA